MRALQIMLGAVAATLSMSAGASDSKLAESEKLALYRAHAKPPVESFHYFNSLNSWTSLGDSAVAIWTRPSEAYLLEVYGPCPDLDFAQAIVLTNQFGRVYTRFDKVIPRMVAGGAQPIPCHIKEIRPLDVKALKAAEQEVREQRKQAAGT
ncbi:MAG TPA: DUF6491 family protein [Lysobacter sp.]|nr:DUF6491 family protein [Lysobacter sp.]